MIYNWLVRPRFHSRSYVYYRYFLEEWQRNVSKTGIWNLFIFLSCIIIKNYNFLITQVDWRKIDYIKKLTWNFKTPKESEISFQNFGAEIDCIWKTILPKSEEQIWWTFLQGPTDWNGGGVYKDVTVLKSWKSMGPSRSIMVLMFCAMQRMRLGWGEGGCWDICIGACHQGKHFQHTLYFSFQTSSKTHLLKRWC